MKKLMIAAALALCGCTNCAVVDISNNDVYGYRKWPWYTPGQEETASIQGQLAHWCWGARTQYPTGTYHRVEIRLYEAGDSLAQTNIMKRSWIWLEGEKE